jgi:hypothetical protein
MRTLGRLSSHPFAIHLTNGSLLRGTHLQVDADTLSWDDLRTGDRTTMPFEDIDHVEFRDRLHGGFDGFLLGFLMGAIPGAILGYTGSPEECSGEGFCFDKPGGAVLVGGAMGLTFGAAGAFVGAIKGSRHRFQTPKVGEEGAGAAPEPRAPGGP